MAKAFEILVAIVMEYAYDRDAFLGIAKCAQEYGDIFIRPKYAGRSFTQEVADLKPDGLIISTSDRVVVDEVASLGIPAVNIANCLEAHDAIPVVGVDDAAIARVAAEHFASCGFKHFAYFADPTVEYFFPRRDGFVKAVKDLGFECHISPPPQKRSGDKGKSASVPLGWAGTWKDADEWLKSLPLPLAVFCPFDRYACELIQLCKSIGFSVPEQVSVIGVDNDQLLCLSIWPSTSSVIPAATQVGYRALRLVREMIEGKPVPSKPVLLPPNGIAIRASSSEMAIADPDVAAAVQYIRSHVREQITIRRIVEHVAVSRRTLERRFLEVLNRTPQMEIHRARVMHAKRLLIETDLPLPEVARRSGFIRHQRLSNVIKGETGLTPSAFRLQYGL